MFKFWWPNNKIVVLSAFVGWWSGIFVILIKNKQSVKSIQDYRKSRNIIAESIEKKEL